jgi:tetratricopeptide (TPR) repeat protein
MEYYDNEEYSIAIPKFREVIKLKDNHYDARLYLGWSYYYTDNYLSARIQATRIVANYPTEDDAGGYYLRTMSNYMLDEYEKAMNDINDCIRLAPEAALGYFVRGVMLFEDDEFNSAYSSLKNAVKRNPDYGDAHGWLGYVSEERGNIINACNHWKKAVELGETDFQESITEYNCR